jgi:hypothetical protein
MRLYKLMICICIYYKNLELDNATATCVAVAEFCCTKDKTRCVLSKQKPKRRNTREERKRRESSLSAVALARQWRLHRMVAMGRCLWPKGVSSCGHCGGSMGWAWKSKEGFLWVFIAGWSPAMEHVGVVVSRGHRPFVRWFCAGWVLEKFCFTIFLS